MAVAVRVFRPMSEKTMSAETSPSMALVSMSRNFRLTMMVTSTRRMETRVLVSSQAIMRSTTVSGDRR